MINCLIVDDEPIALDILETYLSKLSAYKIIGRCENAFEAFGVLGKYDIDLIFLDIQMPELTGLEFLNTLKSPPAVILTTAYRNYAVESYEYEVLDYLLKPFSYERFLKALNRYQRKVGNIEPQKKENNEFIFVKTNNETQKIPVSSILYIEGLKDYVLIYTPKKKHIVHSTLKKLENDTKNTNLLRIHKSFIVNLNKISTYANNCIKVNDKEIPIGRTYKQSFKEVYLK